MTDIIVVGLAAGFLTWLLVKSGSMPNWWYVFESWWINHTPEKWNGKPFTCPLCMSFWLSFVGWLWLWWFHQTYSTTIDVLASSAISLLFVMLMDKLSLTIL